MKKYIVYITINQVNHKIYVGVHGTENPDRFDNYLGDGVYVNSPKSYKNKATAFACAVSKYGPDKFIRKTIRVFDTLKEALELEAKIVNIKFIERTDTYNITIGGGYPPDPSKHIYQYDLEGNFIKEWESIKNITNHYSINKDRIRMTINDKRSFDSSYWSEEKFIKLDIRDYRPSSRGSIRQYTTDGIFLKSFFNTTEAAKELDIDRQKITNAIYGKYATSGFWFLKEDETIESYLDGSIKKEPKIYIYNLDGSFNKEFENISFVKKEFKYNKNDIKRAIKNNYKFQNYYWSYSKYTNILKENPEILERSPRKVYQYTMEGDFVKEWDSITSCKKEYPSVLQVCLGKRNHCKKFKFSFDKLKIQSDTDSNIGLTE